MTKIDENQLKERLIALTRDLILIPSIPSEPQELKRCYSFIRNHVESIDGIVIREFEDKGVPSLIAAPEGVVKPKILMCGHCDVITHPELSAYSSKIQDGRIYGPGAGDMKGALAILLEVFHQVHSEIPGASLGLAITTDEEVGGESGIGYMFQNQGVRCSQAMIPDGGSLNKVTVEEKGILHLSIKTKGKSAHAARPWLGYNALEHLIERLHALRESFIPLQKDLENHWHPTCSITVVKTKNRTVNRIPEYAQAVLDVRFTPPFTAEGMLDEVSKVLGSDIEVDVIIAAEPTHLKPDPLYQLITKEITGNDVELIKDHGGSDARFISQYGIPVVMSRPLVGNLHAADEWIDIASMVQFYRIYEKFLLQKLKN